MTLSYMACNYICFYVVMCVLLWKYLEQEIHQCLVQVHQNAALRQQVFAITGVTFIPT